MFLTESKDYFRGTGRSRSKISGDLQTGMEIIVESVSAWHNLRESMMRLEHTAIMTENKKLLEQGSKGFFQKAVEFFKNLWNKFRNWLTRMIQNLTDRFRSIESFVKKYEKELLAITADQIQDVKFQGHNYQDQHVNRFMGAPLVGANHLNRLKDAESVQDAQNIVLTEILGFRGNVDGDFSSKVKEILRGGSNNQEQIDLTVDMIRKFVQNLKGSKRALGILKANGNVIKAATDRGIAEAQRAIGADDVEMARYKQEVEGWQVASRVLQTVNIAQADLITEYQAVAMRALRAALVASRKGGSGQASESGPVRSRRRSASRRRSRNVLDRFM